MSTFIDTLHAHRAGLERVQYRLGDLANAFELTGNAAMADTLAEVASDIRRLSEALDNAFSDDQKKQLHEAWGSIAENLRAMVRA